MTLKAESKPFFLIQALRVSLAPINPVSTIRTIGISPQGTRKLWNENIRLLSGNHAGHVARIQVFQGQVCWAITDEFKMVQLSLDTEIEFVS